MTLTVIIFWILAYRNDLDLFLVCDTIQTRMQTVWLSRWVANWNVGD